MSLFPTRKKIHKRFTHFQMVLVVRAHVQNDNFVMRRVMKTIFEMCANHQESPVIYHWLDGTSEGSNAFQSTAVAVTCPWLDSEGPEGSSPGLPSPVDLMPLFSSGPFSVEWCCMSQCPKPGTLPPGSSPYQRTRTGTFCSYEYFGVHLHRIQITECM